MLFSHFILQSSEELKIKWFEAVAVGGDEVEATVDTTINLKVKKNIGIRYRYLQLNDKRDGNGNGNQPLNIGIGKYLQL